MKKTVLLAFGLATALAAPSLFAGKGTAILVRYAQPVPLDGNGTLVLDNPTGSVTITGAEQKGMFVIAERIIRAVDEQAAMEGRDNSAIALGGDASKRTIRSVIPRSNGRYSVEVNYNIRVPRSVHVQLSNAVAARTRVLNISGNVFVKNVRGELELAGVTGPITVDTINGNIRVHYNRKPRAHAKLSSVNGLIQVTVPSDASFDWIAETLRGEFYSTVELRGSITENNGTRVYKGSANKGQGAKIQTVAVTGPTYLVSWGSDIAQARALGGNGRPGERIASRNGAPLSVELQPVLHSFVPILMQKPNARTFVLQRNIHQGDLKYETPGNVFVAQLNGNAQIGTSAGEIILGRVSGRCEVRSEGGPINLGDVYGTVDARTGAGDVMIGSARRGGTVSTTGGNIHVGSVAGAVDLTSGGGDITVRRAAAKVHASTRSGDVTIALDPTLQRADGVDAKTSGGNIVLYLDENVRADIDATIITSPNSVHQIVSDLAGLTLTREHHGSRVKIRAVGKLNGGGGRLKLDVEDGNIYLRRGQPNALTARR